MSLGARCSRPRSLIDAEARCGPHRAAPSRWSYRPSGSAATSSGPNAASSRGQPVRGTRRVGRGGRSGCVPGTHHRVLQCVASVHAPWERRQASEPEYGISLARSSLPALQRRV